jgi:uncharacterized protein (DUF1800 family)
VIQQNKRNPFDEIDPDWAWQSWQPSANEPWNAHRIAHLFRRAGFGASQQQIEAAEKSDVATTIDNLFRDAADTDQAWQESTDLSKAVLAGGDPKQLASWWLRWMRVTPNPLREKATLFWHGHFATSADKVTDVESMSDQNQLLRQHALGDFGEMVRAIAKDPAMLLYLDSAYNRKAHPNENFARELLELFCMGEGNYTEKDIQELARCFTGWEIRRNRFRFNSFQHDNGKKKIFGQADIESGEQAIEVVLQQPIVPYFIVSKLFRFFFRDEVDVPEKLLKPLADQMRNESLQIAGVARRMLSSNLFFSDSVIAGKVRSPVELAVSFLRSLDATTNYRRLADSLNILGQVVFYPPSVKGWDGGRAWINSSTLVGRANLIHQIVRDENTQFESVPLADWVRKRAITDLADFVDFVCGQVFAVQPIPETKNKIVQTCKDSGGRKYVEALSLLASIPEIQLS